MMIEPQAVDLLSRITGKKLDKQDVTPPVLFLAALITFLLGVMFADQKVTEEEKQRWQKTLNRFIPAEGTVRQLAQLLSKGIREQKIYKNLDETLTLLKPFSESERLLLIGFGYEMSAADGSIDEAERQHLHQVASLVGLKPAYLNVLETGLTQQSVLDLAVLEDVRALLDPARFHELDTLFVTAASDLLSMLLPAPEKEIPKSHVTSYDRLKAFQTSRKQLDSLCHQLYEIMRSGSERNLLPNILVEDVTKISRKLQSQRFRVAVVGEFSQGKSTLLNALLGEEIQPVRAIPCSGTITILRHGDQKRVICRYKDGRQEEISVDQYKEKASIPKASALGTQSAELAISEIEEIIFEHPDLELCKSGVEIIDSPGLNEHPDRTAITEKLLEDTDAVLLLTNASRLLPEKEKELIQSVRNQLTGSVDNLPAENLFLLVNFMDLLDNDEDREDVTQRLEEFVTTENLLVVDKNRIHYISAKAALKKQDEYLQPFRDFTQALEQFLTVGRGNVEIKRASHQSTNLTQLILLELSQVEKDINLSETERQQILEQIGEASGRAVKVQNYIKELKKQVLEQSINHFNEWCSSEKKNADTKQKIHSAMWVHDQSLIIEIMASDKDFDQDAKETQAKIEQIKKSNHWTKGLRAKIISRSRSWKSEHSHLWSQDRLIGDYANQFTSAMQQEINQWGNEELKTNILNPALEILERTIREELTALQYSSTHLSEEINARFGNQLKLIISGVDDGIAGAGGFLGGGAAGVALAAGLCVFTAVAIVPIIIAAVAAAIFGSFGLGLLDVDGIHDKIKAEVINKGFEKFDESLETIRKQLGETIGAAFDGRLEAADKAIQKIIACYENGLQVNEKNSRISLDQASDNKLWIAQKQQELQRLQQQIEDGLKQVAG